MKNILTKFRSLIKSRKENSTTDMKIEKTNPATINTEIKPIIVNNNGMHIVITHEVVEPYLLDSEVVQNLSDGLGISIDPFINGVAEISWKLKPYKYYEIDYGVPGWERDCIAYAMIDEDGEFLEKFQYTDYYGLRKMREKAEKMVRERNYSTT